MILLIRPADKCLEFCKCENGEFLVEKVFAYAKEINAYIEGIENISGLTGIGFLLVHGGEIFNDPVSLVDKTALAKLETCTGFSPEQNGLILTVAKIFFEKLSAVPQFLLCDTAYFSDLPDEASIYAVPYTLRGQGIKRYGGYGLIHEWVWNSAVKCLDGKVDSIISVYLGDTSNMALIEKGRPLETSIGFTSIEGVLSCSGCGDIDSTIVFQLLSTGMSFQEIYRLLSEESGFSGLYGKECHYSDLFSEGSNDKISKVKKKLEYDIIKNIGAFVSLSGGVDVITFFVNSFKESDSFIKTICEALKFLGINRVKQPEYFSGENSLSEITDNASKVKVLVAEKKQWEIMAQGIDQRLKKGDIK